MFIHPCGSLKLFLGQVKSLEYCLFGFYFIDSDKIDCLGFPPTQIWFWTYAPEGSYDNKRWFRTFVTHLRSLVENMTHFLNHCPFPKISLKLQCQEILGFSRQLIRVLHMGCDHVSHCFGRQFSQNLMCQPLITIYSKL